jgi:hypothetical protein
MSNQQHLARRKIAFVVLTGTTKWLHVRLQLFGLTLEPGQPVRVSNNRSRQHLDGDRPLQVGVGGLVDLAHATHADLGDNFIRAKEGTRSQGQFVWIMRAERRCGADRCSYSE